MARAVFPGRGPIAPACFKEVKTVSGTLKTALSGTYHVFDFDQYAHRNLAEVQYRSSLEGMLSRVLRAGALSLPWPEPRPTLGEVSP